MRRLGRRGYDPEDLFQIGVIGLLKAIDRFDTRYSTAFSTYAVPLIFGELRRFLRDDGLIKVSRSVKEQAAAILKARQQLDQELGRSPTLSELSKHLGRPAAEISAALAACSDAVSFDTPAPSGRAGKQLTVQDMLPDRGPGEQERVERIALQESLQHLSPQEDSLIRLRYFENKTQAETGRLLGMSQVQVSRMEKKILLRLRQSMSES